MKILFTPISISFWTIKCKLSFLRTGMMLEVLLLSSPSCIGLDVKKSFVLLRAISFISNFPVRPLPLKTSTLSPSASLKTLERWVD